MSMDSNSNDLLERVHAVEVAQATQAASMAGAQATQMATQAGSTATNAAMQVGTMTTMATGSVAFVVGIFLGLVLSRR
jgi:hypothetical protein